MSNEADYLEYLKPEASSGDALVKLAELADRQAVAEAHVADLEAQLETARADVRELAEKLIPDLMDQIGMSDFTTLTGLRIEVGETIRASIPKAHAAKAFAWLKANGHAAMIKRVVSVSFGKGEDEQAEELHQKLAGELSLEVEDNASVHASTLAAFVREKLAKGEDVPLELFGVHRQRVAKLGTAKKGKK